MGTDSLKDNGDRFFYSLHDFDTPEVEEEVIEEDVPPPPPTFSEAEVEAFKAKAFEEGKADGHKLALSSIEQKSSLILSQIEASLNTLLQSETARNKVFETESIQLTRAIFETLFPYYKEKLSFDELVALLTDILEKRPQNQPISISLSADILEAVREKFSEAHHAHIQFTPNDSLSDGECLLDWSQGGAHIRTDQLCEQIRISLDQSLEDVAAKGHDDISKQTQEISDE